MANWIDVGEVGEVPDGEIKVFTAEQDSVVVCRVEGQLHAAANVCPHAGMPIGTGTLQGCVLTCPFHGYAYNITDGRNVDFADDVPLSVVPVRETDGRIEVEIED
ncbi:MAG: hypothetical protein CMJ18_11805 [Phycisphaeraceae bacterium]|nr:hypothetical protein [Phycisphaeraceae bacterium]